MLVKEGLELIGPVLEPDPGQGLELVQADRAEEQGLPEILLQMPRAVHAAVKVDAVPEAQQVQRLVHQQLAAARQDQLSSPLVIDSFTFFSVSCFSLSFIF